MPNSEFNLLSWEEFIDFINHRLGEGVSDSGLSNEIAGRTVVWRGRLTKLDLGPDAGRVKVQMNDAKIDIGKGVLVNYSRLTLPVRGHEASWEHLNAGDPVRFRAHLAESGTPFPAFEIIQYSESVRLPMIRVDSAEALRE